uniref:Uncharacterized protein n=1 Tax=Anopheles coluzzii TaxID=1518534 RepID=A0A8W7PTH4_ANOCL
MSSLAADREGLRHFKTPLSKCVAAVRTQHPQQESASARFGRRKFRLDGLLKELIFLCVFFGWNYAIFCYSLPERVRAAREWLEDGDDQMAMKVKTTPLTGQGE